MEDYEDLDYSEDSQQGDDYDEDYGDDEYGEPQNKFQESIKAWERVGFGTSNLLDSSGKNLKGLEDPVDRFKNSIISISLNFKNYIEIDSSDIENLINNLDKLKYIHHKNPTGYVLGYIVTKGGKKINNKLFDQVNNDILPNLSNIKTEDIIRYSRLWLNINNNL
jgi:hypothetical protein